MRTVGIMAALLSVAACNTLFGVDDLEFGGGQSGGAAGATASSTTSTTQSAGGHGTTTSGTAGGGAVGEDCFNGLDDDDNGSVDCDDPACTSGARCEALPAGFDAFASLRVGADAGALCGASYVTEVDGGVDPDLPAPTCSPCICATPANWSCNSPFSIQFSPNSNCSTSAGQWNLFESQVCSWISTPSPYAEAVERMTTGGQCAPGGGALTASDPSFEDQARICEAATTGRCSANDAQCVPSEATCVVAQGEATCPESHPNQTVVYTSGFSDDRGCADCACSAPSQVPCVVTTDFYNDSACTDLDATWVHDASCAPWTISGTHYYVVRSAEPSPGYSCDPSGGAPAGEVAALGAVTVCCL